MTPHPLDAWTTEIPGLVPWSWRPTTFKRYSSNGVVRLYSRIDGEWTLVAKRTTGATWRGVPNLRARRKALAELRGMA